MSLLKILTYQNLSPVRQQQNLCSEPPPPSNQNNCHIIFKSKVSHILKNTEKVTNLTLFFKDSFHPLYSPVCKSGRVTVSISVPTSISVIAITSPAQFQPASVLQQLLPMLIFNQHQCYSHYFPCSVPTNISVIAITSYAHFQPTSVL